MSKLFVDLSIAFRSLIQHGRRTLFLGAAIAAVTALLILLTGLSTGIRETMIDTATTLEHRPPERRRLLQGHRRASPAPVVTDYQQCSRSCNEVVARAGLRRPARARLGQARLRHRLDAGWASPASTSARAAASSRCCRSRSGKLDDLAEPGTILIFEDQAEKLDVKVGDAITISAPTTRGVDNTIDVRVVAIARDIGLLSMWNIFVPMAALRALYQLNQNATGAIQIMLQATSTCRRSRELAARLRAVWRRPATG